jgi:hypothetical protein
MPKPNEVPITVKAASINATDHALIANRFPVPPGTRPDIRALISEGAENDFKCQKQHIEIGKVTIEIN